MSDQANSGAPPETPKKVPVELPKHFLWRYRENAYSNWTLHPIFLTEKGAKEFFRGRQVHAKVTQADLVKGI